MFTSNFLAHAWFFELLRLLRKALFVLIAVAMSKPSEQCFAATFLMVLSLAFTALLQPYIIPWINVLDCVGHIVIIIAIMVGITWCGPDSEPSDTASAALVLMVVVFAMVLMMALMYQACSCASTDDNVEEKLIELSTLPEAPDQPLRNDVQETETETETEKEKEKDAQCHLGQQSQSSLFTSDDPPSLNSHELRDDMPEVPSLAALATDSEFEPKIVDPATGVPSDDEEQQHGSHTGGGSKARPKASVHELS
jgi:hypothetical protein